ncbi:hypothetical protein QTP70_009370 [Hemibagrus guttatus]|uniref:Reverse transcriptase RNase H-like domain-containing protein n=1 Tax=Hemibagrus guttatus TaxID=175788 RepID=A0AAE0URJ6_9TELE|nr:hypothetical protein QTP70_009370 [Hemibagrus guttatus]
MGQPDKSQDKFLLSHYLLFMIYFQVIGPVQGKDSSELDLENRKNMTLQRIERIVDPGQSSGARQTVRVQTAGTQEADTNMGLWHPPVDLGHLRDRQREIIKEMLYEESSVFSKGDDDIGCIPSLQMSITLQNDIPVQRAYSAVTKPLFSEVKGYIQELLAKGWFALGKVDYSLLNKKTIPDRHPLHRSKLRVNGYGSRTLMKAERNYRLHSSKLEFLALKSAVCKKFRDYLFYAQHFMVYTDNNSLTYVMSTAKLNAVGHRWVMELSDFRLVEPEEETTPKGYAKQWAHRMSEVYKIAESPSQQSSARGKAQNDRKVSGVVLKAGDPVLVRNLGERGGPGKLRSYWKKAVYVVKEQVSNNPVYVIYPENSDRGKTRTLHQNLLLLVNDLPVEAPAKTPASTRPERQKRTVRHTSNDNMDDKDSDLASSDAESSAGGYWLRAPVNWPTSGSDQPPEQVPVREKIRVLQKISARIKGKVYRTVVRPAMLYGLETVSLRKRQESELEVAELKMLRMNFEVNLLLKARDVAFKSGDAEDYSRARANMKRGIRKAKHAHKLHIEEHFHNNSNPRCMWKGIQTITDHKPAIQTVPTSNAFLPDELNHFFARFNKPL